MKPGQHEKPPSPTRRKRPQKRKVFIEHYRKTGNIKESAKKAQIDRSTVYDWQRNDEEFKAAMDSALDDYVDTLEKEADRRAVKGTVRPVYYKGSQCGGIREYSDTLLIFRLNGLRPEKYKRVETRSNDAAAQNDSTTALKELGEKLPG